VKVGAAVVALCLLAGGAVAYRSFNASNAPAPSPAPSPAPAPGAATSDAGSCPDGMLYIAGGNMFMGRRDLGKKSDAWPPHPVMVSSFCLDKTEVTTRRYLACANGGHCEKAPNTVSWPDITPADQNLYGGFCNASHEDRADHPMNCVSWSMSNGFCKYEGARLPTEAEWEFAARGPKQLDYPWGEEPPSADRLNACGTECAHWFATKAHEKHYPVMYDASDGYEGTAPVGSFPAGASAAGVLDLAGNVLEWTADWYGPYASAEKAVVDPKGPETGQERVVRGGAFNSSDANWARPAYRWKTNPETYNHGIGFRCAASPL
jgi:eukaryotic-like serine/threonine-protein kinase